MLKQVFVPIVYFLRVRVASAACHLLHVDVKALVYVAEGLTRIVYLLLPLAFVEAMVHELKERLHELGCICLAVQAKLFDLLTAIIVLE